MKVKYDAILGQTRESDIIPGMPIYEPARSPLISDANLGLVTPFDALEDICIFFYNVDRIAAIRLKLVTADPAVTGNIVLVPLVNGVERTPVTVAVSTDQEWREIALSPPANGRLAIRRNHASIDDTVKSGGNVITVLATDVTLTKAV